MTYDQFLMLAIGCMGVSIVFLIRKVIRDQPKTSSPRRLNGKSSSGVGTDGLPPSMVGGDCGSSDCGGDGGGD